MAKQNKQQYQKSNIPQGNQQDAEFAQEVGQNSEQNGQQQQQQNNKQQNNKYKK